MSATNNLLASIAYEEAALARIVNVEADKLRVLINSPYNDFDISSENLSADDAAGLAIRHSKVGDLLDANKNVERMLRKVIVKEMLLSFQLEDVVELDGIESMRPDYPSNISIACRVAPLYVGESFKYVATVFPSNARNRTIIWSVNNQNIAWIDQDGTVTALQPGEVTITAETMNGATASCQLTIEEIVPTDNTPT